MNSAKADIKRYSSLVLCDHCLSVRVCTAKYDPGVTNQVITYSWHSHIFLITNTCIHILTYLLPVVPNDSEADLSNCVTSLNIHVQYIVSRLWDTTGKSSYLYPYILKKYYVFPFDNWKGPFLFISSSSSLKAAVYVEIKWLLHCVPHQVVDLRSVLQPHGKRPEDTGWVNSHTRGCQD